MTQPRRDRIASFTPGAEAALAMVLVYTVVFGTAVLGQAQWLAYGAFLYAPVIIAGLRGIDFAAYGLLSPSLKRSLLTGFAASAVIFPLFAGGYYALAGLIGLPWHAGFAGSPLDVLRFAAVQLVLVAFAEEYFYRGYLQQRLDRVWPPRRRVLGATLGPGWLVATALFAAGHLALELNPARLLTFFPGLWFGWLRARTGDIYGATLAHGASNILIAWLQGQSLG